MKFSTREDIEAPIDFVWQQISDIGAFERQAMRRGADVRRRDSGPVQQGSAWDVDFVFRGKDRKLVVTMATFDAPNAIHLDAEGTGLEGQMTVDLVPLTPHRTRFAVAIELRAKTLSARLLLQSLKLAKANLTHRFKTRVADYSEEIERRQGRKA